MCFVVVGGGGGGGGDGGGGSVCLFDVFLFLCMLVSNNLVRGQR